MWFETHSRNGRETDFNFNIRQQHKSYFYIISLLLDESNNVSSAAHLGLMGNQESPDQTLELVKMTKAEKAEARQAGRVLYEQIKLAPPLRTLSEIRGLGKGVRNMIGKRRTKSRANLNAKRDQEAAFKA